MTPDAPSDPEVKVVSLPEGKAGYTEAGDGPAVLAIHGLPGSVRDFRYLGSCVEGPLKFVRIDMPGFGITDPSNIRNSSIPERAGFVIRVMDALHISKCVILGHSMGGPVALELAARHADRIRGLVLLSGVGLRPHKLHRKMPRIRTVSMALNIPVLRSIMLTPIRRHFTDAGFPSSTTDRAIIQCIHWVAATDFVRINENVASLQVPVFLSWASDDPWIEEEIFREFSDSCPSGPRLSFPDGGHNIQKTRAVEIGEALIEWVPWVMTDV